MLRKEISYVDYDGNDRKENFYFNYSKSEIIDMQFSFNGGLSEFLKKIVETQDIPKLYQYFKEFVLGAYGEKSPDGKRFVKNKELSEAFSQTEAYTNLMMEILGYDNPEDNANSAADFVLAVLPADYAKAMQDEASQLNLSVVK